MKIKIPVIIASIVLAFIIIVSSFFHVFYDKPFYRKQYAKNGVVDVLGLEKTEAITDNLFGFFRDKEELRFFEGDQASHLQDVKDIIQPLDVIYYVLIGLLLLLLIWVSYHDSKNFLTNLFKVTFIAPLIAIGLMVVLGLLFLNFGSAFESFHQVFFPQGNYTFPVDSLLITLFPLTFFKAAAFKMFLDATIKSVIVILLTLVFKRQKWVFVD